MPCSFFHVVRPAGRRPRLELAECWRFREVLAALAVRDVKLRYKQTLLGVGWVALQPLLAALVLTFVFGRVAKLPSEGVPYLLYALTGLLGFQLFSTTVVQASNSLVANEPLVSKVFFPRLLIPLSVVPAALLDFVVAAALLAVLMAARGIAPPPQLLFAPVWLALMLALAAGLGAFAAVLAARYRDVQRVVPLGVQLLLYASPVAYGLAAVRGEIDGAAEAIYLSNPLVPLLEGLRWSVLGTSAPPWPLVAQSAAVCVAALVAGAYAFQGQQRRIADVL